MRGYELRPDRDVRRDFIGRRPLFSDVNSINAGSVDCAADLDPHERARRLAQHEQRIRYEEQQYADPRRRKRGQTGEETTADVEALFAAVERAAKRAAKKRGSGRRKG